ncbi:integral membrane sensor signal transduction histidine kinase [Arcobacter nitrofigilis DSM 7299]|uniref:histidine kinase n=1 Tax=Arcobacter nitrofigilis (strain ATCC 33309 / DSM 7299 / CCUG 15893 / LMG 7604 / NCTC 12251 / CI) TaxID=572480 RepID=D5V3C7_ARCNC|nr:cache domain-containing protein [Arcobacter nitrofigilis]ADG92709.1 integral membrane sensor signal transduction histidine kinase [Arcobacter nitrofigilis DSM 7299]
MSTKNEKTILKIIKYSPPILIIFISTFLIIFIYIEYNTTYLQEKKIMEKEFIKFNKEIVKNNVDVAYNTILEIKKNTEIELKKSIKQRVYEAIDIANRIYNENKDTKDKQTIKKMIKDALIDIRFNEGRGYYYIYSFDYICELLPLDKSLEGKSFYNYQDSNGKYLIRDMIKQLKLDNEGFMTWYYHKPNDMKNNYKKIGFNVYFKPLDWFIGTGEYVDDYEESAKKSALGYLKSLRYLNNNYIFAIDYDGTYLFHIKKEVVGQNVFKFDDVRYDKNLAIKISDIVENGTEGYITYIQNKKPDTNKPTKKTSFIKIVPSWNWIIGQGFYDDRFEKTLEEKKLFLEKKFTNYISNIIIFSALLIFILLFVSILISKILQKKFQKYKNDIKIYVNENNKQRDILAHQSKMTAMGDMIANIAHQWRQPLSVITTAASGVKVNNELNLLESDSLNKSMDLIVEQSLFLSHIIEDFKDFLNSKNEKTYFNIERVVDKAINLAYGKFENNEFEIIKDIDNIQMENFENQLLQILINILKNSFDQFEKIVGKRLLFISVKAKNNKVKILIKDNAGGIQKDIIERIFEPYFTTKHQYQGTGMGLYMIEEIVRKHMHGNIFVTNDEYEYENIIYKGANFHIEIPLKCEISNK